MKKSIIFTILVIMLVSCIDKKITREQAKKIIIDEIVTKDTLNHRIMIFLSENKLKKGDRIAPMGFSEKTKIIKSSSWFAWVDDEPEAEFAHETRFVFLNSKTGKLRILNNDWYPVLNDSIVLWKEPEKWETEDLLIYSDY